MERNTVRRRAPLPMIDAASKGPRFEAQMAGLTILYDTAPYTHRDSEAASLARSEFARVLSDWHDRRRA